MSIVLARIDDRLVHAQVIEGWLKVVGANHILIVSDDVARDEIQRTMYTLAVPYGIKLSCMSVKDAAANLQAGVFAADSLMILLSSLEDAWRLVDSGADIKSFNVGGLHSKPGKKSYTPTVTLDEKDMDFVNKLISRGIELETRVLPAHERIGILEVIKKADAI